VFLHRRFRHGFVFINTQKGITKPTDLIGRRIGIKSFLVTAIHWMRGLLEKEYGVPHQSVEWVAELDEDVDFTPPPGLKLTRLPEDKSVETMLAEGELDAVLHSDLIKPFLANDPRVARLFPAYKDEEISYYRKTGIFPIMHVMGIRQEILDRRPWVAINLYSAFLAAKAVGMRVGRRLVTVRMRVVVLRIRLVGMGVVGGISGVISLRLLGIAPKTAVRPLERLYPLIWFGFWVNAVTGTALLLASASARLVDPTFYIKMIFIFAGLAVLQLMRKKVFHNFGPGGALPEGARTLAWAGLFCWLGAVTAGRLLAYI